MARRRQAVTIKHVAADAGVSLQTVSRVINNEPNVRPAMRERVQTAIERLGYVPSIAAQQMSGSRSYLILALNDRERTIAGWRERSGNDWVDQMLLGGMLTCDKHGYRMLVELVDTHNDHVERELRAALAALRPDGIILTPPHSDNPLIVSLLAERGIPFARIGSQAPGPGFALTMGDEQNAAMATRHLIELGHRRIGMIAGPEHYSLSKWRVDGWRRTLEEAGLPYQRLCEAGDFSFASGQKATEALLGMRPTALLVSNDQMALGALAAARAQGLRVPDDLSVVSFDNTPVVRFTDPPLSAVDQPVAETIGRAVELIIHAGRQPRPDGPVVIEGTFVARGSTGAPPPDRD